jgi:hypothetical protein
MILKKNNIKVNETIKQETTIKNDPRVPRSNPTPISEKTRTVWKLIKDPNAPIASDRIAMMYFILFWLKIKLRM